MQSPSWRYKKVKVSPRKRASLESRQRSWKNKAAEEARLEKNLLCSAHLQKTSTCFKRIVAVRLTAQSSEAHTQKAQLQVPWERNLQVTLVDASRRQRRKRALKAVLAAWLPRHGKVRSRVCSPSICCRQKNVPRWNHIHSDAIGSQLCKSLQANAEASAKVLRQVGEG